MGDFEFIIESLRFSYSSTSNFGTCKYGFKLTYIEGKERENNFFAEYGLVVHECMEKFFSGEVESYMLSELYKSVYDRIVKTEPPPFPRGMEENYYNSGLEFFDNFDFPLDNYDVLAVETKLNLEIAGVPFVAKPDLVLREKGTNKTVLFDFKTSMPFRKLKTGLSPDRKKIEEYYKQMYLYTYALRNVMFEPIDEITLWFPRANQMVTIPWSLQDENAAIAHISGIVEQIKQEKDFPASPENTYFCANLCSVRKFCIYRT